MRTTAGERYLLVTSLSLLLIGDCGGMRSRSEHIFSDMPLIRLADPLKHGFHIVMHDAAHDYLIANPLQLPALYVSALPLDGSHPALRQILYKDSVTADKMIKIFGLREKSWYFVCLEYETISIGAVHNESTGTHCRIFRTLDKFGKSTNSTVTSARLRGVGDSFLEFQLEIDAASFPLKMTAYLLQEPASQARKRDLLLDAESPTPVSVPGARVFILDHRAGVGPRKVHLVFDELQPASAFGGLCVVQEPLLLHALYTSMGRSVDARLKSCFFNDSTKEAQLQTKEAYNVYNVAASGESSRVLTSRQTRVQAHSMRLDNGGASGRFLASSLLVSLVVSSVIARM